LGPHSFLFNGYWILSRGKWGLEVNHSRPSSDELKNERSHTSAVHTRLRSVDKEKEKKYLSQLHASKLINGMSLHHLLIVFLLNLLLLLLFLLLLLLLLLRLLLHVSSYFFVSSVFCCMLLNILLSFVDIQVKVKESRYRPGVAHKVPGG